MLITCTGCNNTLRVPDDSAGKHVQCPTCAKVFEVPAAEATAISSTPLPPTPAEASAGPTAGTEVTASLPAATEQQPPSTERRPRAYDDDEYDDPIHLDVRRRGSQPGQVNSLAMTAMILGIVSVPAGTIGICACGIFAALIALLSGGLAITFGIQGKTPGSESYANTGIVCGTIAVVCSLLGIVGTVVWIAFMFNRNFP